MKDYICVVTWDPYFEITRYRYVHKSVKDPKEHVKYTYPEEEIHE